MILLAEKFQNTWGTANEFLQVETDFDAVVSANTNWAARNNTQPLPIYMGEFGVDNEADNHHTDRKKWLSWIRMQAEKKRFFMGALEYVSKCGYSKRHGAVGMAILHLECQPEVTTVFRCRSG